ncbi:M56 family metallopeptidase [Constantimarinum furrinae]|uniref:Peptidase M56 domain-containing protein n=1 Tax=Constantimarinum furrinae TaxID=2562285 RepID=A0A7G8PR37_9FLAO|nr:hypothetical protein [Constantimarinum furrinae]QNJ96803.1 hypothetical protein ALE3EI_0213 [Constantimarinum furrinae]
MELLDYILKSAGILTIFYLFYAVMLRKNTHFTAKRHYLFGGITAALLLPLFEYTKIIYIEIPSTVVSATSVLSPVDQAVIPSESLSVDWWEVLFVCYLTGILVMTVRLIVQLISLLTLLTGNPTAKKGKFTYVYVSERIAPFSFFNYIVFNPDLHQENDLTMILQHEKVHASQWHTIDILAANLMRILQWANPFSWFYKVSLEENLEYIADSETAQKVPSVKQYQLALVKASSSLTTPALTNNFYHSFIKKRIIMLNKSNSKKYDLWKLAIILPILAVFLWSFNVSEKIEYIETEVTEDINVEPTSMDALPEITSEETSISETNETQNSEDSTPTTVAVVSENQTEDNERIQQEVVAETSFNEVYILITKSTTKAELEIHKKELKREHNIDFNYSNLEYNSKGELISIAIEYNTNKGGHGNYHVVEDDGPIKDFYFFVSEDGRSGFVAEGSEERMIEREKKIKERMEKRVERIEEMKKERVKKRNEMADVRRAKVAELVETEKKLVKAQNRVVARASDLEDRYAALVYSDGNEVSEDVDDEMVYVISKNTPSSSYVSSSGRNSVVIKKNTTDAQLASMKEKLEGKGITFTYRNVKRNSRGEITGIKLRMKDGNGSETSSNVKSDDEPISPIRLTLD